MASPSIFILASCDDGPFILSRYDAHPDDHVGQGAYMLERGSADRHEIDTLIALCRKRRERVGDGLVVVDCGANVGGHTVPLAKAMRGWGEVIAIEAQERVFYALAGNIALNNLFNARAIWAAVGDKCGVLAGPKVDYHQPCHVSGVSMIPANNGNVGQDLEYSIPTPVVTLDSLNLPSIDLLKIDVEGMEPQVMYGGSRLISNHRPIIQLEWIFNQHMNIKSILPNCYRWVTVGSNVLAMPEDDPIWNNLVIEQ